MKTLILLAASLAAFAQAPGAVRYLSYGGAPTAGDCTLALAGARVGVDTSTTPDTVYDCIDGGWVARPVKVVSGVPTVQSATDTKLVVKAGASQAGNLQEWQDTAGGVRANVNQFGEFVTTGTDGSYAYLFSSEGAGFQISNSDNTSAFYLANGVNVYGGVGAVGPYSINATTTTIKDQTTTTGETLLSVVAGDAQTTKSVVLQTGGRIQAPLTTPTTSGETGTAGTIAWDANYIYICTSANTWKRVALSAF